jgi:hypothetical protein
MAIDIGPYRKVKEEYIEAEEVVETIVNLLESEVLIITKQEDKVRITKVRASRFLIKPEDL